MKIEMKGDSRATASKMTRAWEKTPARPSFTCFPPCYLGHMSLCASHTNHVFLIKLKKKCLCLRVINFDQSTIHTTSLISQCDHMDFFVSILVHLIFLITSNPSFPTSFFLLGKKKPSSSTFLNKKSR